MILARAQLTVQVSAQTTQLAERAKELANLTTDKERYYVANTDLRTQIRRTDEELKAERAQSKALTNQLDSLRADFNNNLTKTEDLVEQGTVDARMRAFYQEECYELRDAIIETAKDLESVKGDRAKARAAEKAAADVRRAAAEFEQADRDHM